jgi:1-deoxy-D-xylulose-5-phosphate reductoisomerase
VNPRDVVLLGSTGSIGTQALDIVGANPDRFRVVALGAGGGNVGLLAAQALEFGVEVVGLAKASTAQDLQLAFYAEAQRHGYPHGGYRIPKILTGPDAMAELARWPCDVVLNGVVGSLGLAPTLAALRSGRTLALANKESLIAGGPLVKAAVTRPGQIVPVDSEHSALAQCARAGGSNEIRRLILTASGGPFRGRSRADLEQVTVEEALAHPTWNMGPVVTINSATLVNKGLEVIEAHELFGLDYDNIQVMIHPPSVIHSMVEFVDGSTLARAGRGRGGRARLDEGAHVGTAAPGRGGLSGCRPGQGGRTGRPVPPGDLQRGERGVRSRFHGATAAVSGDRRHHRAGTRRRTRLRLTGYRRRGARGRSMGAGLYAGDHCP